MLYSCRDSENWYLLTQVDNGGCELSPSSALCGGLPERVKVAVKSDNWLTGISRVLSQQSASPPGELFV